MRRMWPSLPLIMSKPNSMQQLIIQRIHGVHRMQQLIIQRIHGVHRMQRIQMNRIYIQLL